MKTPLQQSPEFAACLNALGQTAKRAETGLIIRRKLPLIGETGLTSRATPTCTEALRRDRRAGLRLINADSRCDKVVRAAGFRQIFTPGHIALLDLRRDLLRGLHPKWRNRLRKAQSSDLRSLVSAWDGRPHWLLEREAEQQRSRRYRAYPPAFSTCYAKVNPGRALIVEIRAPDDPVAAMLFLCHGTDATYQTGWTSARGRRLSAHNLASFTAMTQLRDRGIRWLDLGLIDTERNPGLARFKLGTGAALHRLGGTWLAVPGL